MKKIAVVLCTIVGVFTAGLLMGLGLGSQNREPPGATYGTVTIYAGDASVRSEEETLIRHQLFGGNYVNVPFVPDRDPGERDDGVEL